MSESPGMRLEELVGALRDERVLIAVVGEAPVVHAMTPLPYRDRGRDLHLVLYRHPGGGLRVLDLTTEDDSRGQRWWRVEAAAREARLDTIPIRYDGSAGDIPERFLTEHPGEVVLLRLASRGPWFNLYQRPAPVPECKGNE